MSDVPRKIKCVDDTLLHDESVAEAFWHTYGFLQKCHDNGVTLRPDKFSFCKRNVTFAGYVLGWEDYQPSHDLIKSIADFTMPASPSLTDIRSWFGLVNQELLKKPAGRTVYWDETLNAIFTSAKDTIKKLAAEGLKFYDTSRPTAVLTDYSRQGIGFVVSQQYCQCVSLEAPMCCPNGWKLVLCGSRHLTAAEKNYSTLEGEALAIAWCLKKARLTSRGKSNCAADALSRYPALASAPEDSDEADDEAVCAVMVAAAADASTDDVGHVVDLRHVEEEAVRDEEYRLLHECVANDGWGERKDAEPAALRPRPQTHRARQSPRRSSRQRLNASQSQAVCILARHRRRSGAKRRQCQVCEMHTPSQPAEPLLPTPPPQFPFQQAVADLFQLQGNVYIAYADRLTGWLEVEHLSGEATSSRLITLFRRWFTRFGIPEELSCDGGTNLTSHESRRFFEDWRVTLRISSSHYAQSNGRAKAAVKSAKRLLRGNTTRGGSLDTDSIARAILQYLNTPCTASTHPQRSC
ncbi:uncharacterized protein LOC123498232 [Portunus trituberculatus]|uniref:uncharacterized protein LOC123498232 n=1 Tax=Portunus trituberculatus TaxID=210409 RepID=UPI001E1CC015|nr:uncharacterized protein LOC123498232 [Portunus trituberculatus]